MQTNPWSSPMRFHVAQLLKEGIGATRSYQVYEAEAVVADDGSQGLVEGALSLLRTKLGVLASATLRLEYPDVCSRCLRPLKVPLELHLEEEYLPTVDILTGAALPRPEDPGTFRIDEHHILDLTEAFRQYRVLAVPMKPLCQPNCAGLCPVCGQNLNESSCACPRQEYDLRWSALAELARQSEPDNN
jgi:uncharacterized protein